MGNKFLIWGLVILSVGVLLAFGIFGMFAKDGKFGDVLPTGINRTYVDSVYHFSFQFPKSFSTEVINDIGSRTVLVQNVSKTSGCQIAISPFDEDLRILTKDRILHDIPNIVMESESTTTIASGIGVFQFVKNDAGNRTREAWFINDKVLYQISCFMEEGDLMKSILDSWNFKIV